MHGRIAIIGAGISGLTCAGLLRDAGAEVVVFDKARGPGGRMSTRRRADERFDHGAQYFTARDEAFARAVEQWHADGVVAPWSARFAVGSSRGWDPVEPTAPRWVGTPRMSAIGRHLAVGLDVRYSTRITALTRRSTAWTLTSEHGPLEGSFAGVVLSCPGPQARALLPANSPTHAAADGIRFHPCWAIMASFDAPVRVAYDGIELEHPVLAWAARDSSKPGRDSGERWVAHATPDWSLAHLEEPADAIEQAMGQALERWLAAKATQVVAHRWRYGRVIPHSAVPYVVDDARGLALCGDGLTRPRVEDAWRSGHRLGQHLVGLPTFGAVAPESP